MTTSDRKPRKSSELAKDSVISNAAVRPMRSFRRNVGAAVLGNITYAACQFGMLAALVWLTTPTAVGWYALALAIAGPVFALTNLKLRQVQVTDAAGAYKSAHYIALRLGTTALAFTFITVGASLSNMPKIATTTLIGITALKATESLIDILYGAMQRLEQLQLVAISQMTRAIGGFAGFISVLAVTRRVDVAVATLVVLTAMQALSLAYQTRRLGVKVRPQFDRDVLIRLARLSAPLGWAVSIGALTVNIPRYFLGAYSGAADLGVFTAQAYTVMITGTIIGSIAEAASPRLSNLYNANDSVGFLRLMTRLVLAGCALGLAGIVGAFVGGAAALDLAFGPKYAAESTVFTFLMITAAVQYATVFLGTSINALRLFSIQLPINATVLASVAISCAFLVPKHGLMGAALSLLFGQVIQACCYGILTWRVVLPRVRAGSTSGAS
jgi:O-antigen/teichoic acid export membrane protein